MIDHSDAVGFPVAEARAYRVIVTGSRDWSDRNAIERAFVDFVGNRRVVIVHGDCPTGADAIADEYAQMIGAEVERHPADWDRYGRGAGPIRNRDMAYGGADLCIAFWDGQSKGTAHMIAWATKAGIPVRIVPAAKGGR